MGDAIKVGAFFVIAQNNVAGCLISIRTPTSPQQSGSFEHKLQARGQETLNIEGMAQTSDGRTIFLADTNGELYSLDTDAEVFTRLGSKLPPDRQGRGERVMQLRNLTMSCNEQKLFTIPTQVSGGSGAWHLYET